jgi:hypothetical protein
MSDLNPNLEGPSPAGSQVVNETHLEVTNSHIGNASQVVNSPGAVVTQLQIEQSSSATGILAGILGVLLLLLVAVLPLLGKLIPSGLSFALVGLSFWLMVGGFFSWVESLLKISTKSDVAGWLVGVTVGKKIESWPETFAKVFDRVFGERHLSWQCFRRSCVATSLILSLTMFFMGVAHRSAYGVGYSPVFVAAEIPINVFPDYLSLFITRYSINVIQRRHSVVTRMMVLILVLAVNVCLVSFSYAFIGDWWVNETSVFKYAKSPDDWASLGFAITVMIGVMVAGVFPSIWLWLYAGSGFLLKAARRFDLGFDWFNRKFDIENKPLQSMGLMAGALVAMVYWGGVIISRVFAR